MFSSDGILAYSNLDGYYRLVLEVDPELHRYLRGLIPSRFTCKVPRYSPHITVVRNEPPRVAENWGKYEGKLVSFTYDPFLNYDGTYWWIKCYSEELILIRLELGLASSHHHTRPPTDEECFHSTVGNSKT